MLHVFGDCHVESMDKLKKDLNTVNLIGVSGLWSSSLSLKELAKVLEMSKEKTKKLL